MENIQSRIIGFLLIFAMAASPWCSGIQAGPVILTPSTVALLLAAIMTLYSRITASLPLVPLMAFKEPAVFSALVYFLIGMATWFVAEDKFALYKEIVQRTTIIWLPFFSVSMGLRRIEDAKRMLLTFLPTCAVVALVSTFAAITSKFEAPAFVLGLHKNMTASLCATMAIICIAYLITNKQPKIKVLMVKLNNRLVMASLLVLALLGIVAAQGRGGVLEVGIALFVMLIAIRAKPSTLIKAIVICVVGGAVVYKLLPEKAVEHVVSTKLHSANQIRIEIWTDMAQNFMANPFIACGWGNPYVDSKGYFYYDLCCVLLFDWMQMSFIGAIALLFMIASSVVLAITTARRVNIHSVEGFVSLAASGIVAGKFAHGMIDTFWIARGANLHTWIAVGLCLFVKLLVDQKPVKFMGSGRSRTSSNLTASRT